MEKTNEDDDGKYETTLIMTDGSITMAGGV